MHPYLSIEKLDVTFGRGPMRSEVLRDVSLRVAKGEFIAIIGHSGCGKSTLLNVVAGLVKATGGGVILEDREVNAPGPDGGVPPLTCSAKCRLQKWALRRTGCSDWCTRARRKTGSRAEAGFGL